MSEPLQTYLDFINETAFLAGRLTLGYFQSNLAIDTKADGSVVTAADRGAEQLIRARIERYFPEHAILGEEYGVVDKPHSPYRWIIDPIDGTYSFVHGVPIYAVLIGLEINGKVEVGTAHFPAIHETISAASGLGCFWNNLHTHVSPVQTLSDGLVICNDSAACHEYGHGPAWERISGACKSRRGWGDAYGYLLVATGRAELAMDPAMKVWDNGPFPPIFAEAGGYFGDWKGNATIYGGEAIATSLQLLPEVLELIGEK
ncbi:MAG: histidinol phosphate phosphatase [Chloroflexi bacterium]|nr:histidinol phosphate phosphatase [Chloroflexota bacterium]